MKRKIVIIGPGRAGIATGVILERKGHMIVALIARSKDSLEKAKNHFPGAMIIESEMTDAVRRALQDADLVLVTTNDDQIEAACNALAASGALGTRHTVIHMSGAGGLDLLQSARDTGAHIACVHPIQTLPDVDLAIQKLPGSYCGVTADADSIVVARELVAELGGKVLLVDDADKPLYHAAACIVSNYLVALLDIGQLVYEAADIERSMSIEAMMPLVEATLANVREVGTVAALTGPIARGDVSSVKKHLSQLEKSCPGALEVYKALGNATIDIALKKGTIDEAKAAQYRDRFSL